jgi:hypothetical protein
MLIEPLGPNQEIGKWKQNWLLFLLFSGIIMKKKPVHEQ